MIPEWMCCYTRWYKKGCVVIEDIIDDMLICMIWEEVSCYIIWFSNGCIVIIDDIRRDVLQ